MINVAIYGQNKSEPKVGEAPPASARPVNNDEVLIQNVAVASNPKDWKMGQWNLYPTDEFIDGDDVAGIVVEVGSDVKEFKKGDRVGAFTYMVRDSKYGGYQPLTVAPSSLTFHIPDNVSFEEAATIPLASLTAVIGLFSPTRLALTPPTDDATPASGGEAGAPLVVWGGSSSVGVFVVQIAKFAGLKVIAVASSKNADYVKSLGADEVIDYRNKDDATLIKEIVEAVKKTTDKPLKHAYDAISEGNTTESLAKVIEHFGEGGVITTVLPTKWENAKEGDLPKGVSVKRESVGDAYGPDAELASKFIRLEAKWLGEGKFKANNVQIVPGGLKGVPEGLQMLKDGKVSAAKLVYRIADTQ